MPSFGISLSRFSLTLSLGLRGKQNILGSQSFAQIHILTEQLEVRPVDFRLGSKAFIKKMHADQAKALYPYFKHVIGLLDTFQETHLLNCL